MTPTPPSGGAHPFSDSRLPDVQAGRLDPAALAPHAAPRHPFRQPRLARRDARIPAGFQEHILGPGKLEQFVHDTIAFHRVEPASLYEHAAQHIAPQERPPPFAEWPIHLPAHTDFITLEKVCSVAGTAESLAAVRHGFRYLYDEAMYAAVPRCKARDVPRARLTPEQGAAALSSGHFRVVRDRSLVSGYVFLFAVPQPAKRRFRLVAHPVVQNDTLATAPKVSFRSIHERKQLVFKGARAAQADQKAYYPAFLMPEHVGYHYCTRLPVPGEGGRTRWVLAALTRAPTGLASQVFTGVAVSAHLKAFAIRSAGDDDHIDNYLFVDDDDEKIAADLRELNARNSAAGGTLNEKEQLERDPRSLIASRLDWVGLALDFEAKTVRCTQALCDKVALTWQLLSDHPFSYRQLGSHVGMLRYAALLIDVPLASFFRLNSFMSQVGLAMQQCNDECWDERVDITEPVWNDLAAFTQIVLRNEPQQQVRDLLEPDFYVTVDACASGYGYAALELRTGAVFTHSERWSARDWQVYGSRWHASTFSESQGALRMKQHLLAALEQRDASSPSPSPPPRRYFLVGSDSVTAVALFRKGYATKSYFLNEVAKADRGTPLLQRDQWAFRHIAGKDNVVADKLSRLTHGDPVGDWDQAAVAESLRRLLGESASPPADGSGGGSGVLVGHTRTTTTAATEAPLSLDATTK